MATSELHAGLGVQRLDLTGRSTTILSRSKEAHNACRSQPSTCSRPGDGWQFFLHHWRQVFVAWRGLGDAGISHTTGDSCASSACKMWELGVQIPIARKGETYHGPAMLVSEARRRARPWLGRPQSHSYTHQPHEDTGGQHLTMHLSSSS